LIRQRLGYFGPKFRNQSEISSLSGGRSTFLALVQGLCWTNTLGSGAIGFKILPNSSTVKTEGKGQVGSSNRKFLSF
jgi:hypothetical protein